MCGLSPSQWKQFLCAVFQHASGIEPNDCFDTFVEQNDVNMTKFGLVRAVVYNLYKTSACEFETAKHFAGVSVYNTSFQGNPDLREAYKMTADEWLSHFTRWFKKRRSEWVRTHIRSFGVSTSRNLFLAGTPISTAEEAIKLLDRNCI